MYVKPTKEQIEFAVEEGWDREDAERGYTIFDYDGLGILQIEAICDCYPNGDYDDEACAIEAEKSGFCKIIPVNELPENFEANEHSVRWFGWVDTPENRKAIQNYCDVITKKGDNKMEQWIYARLYESAMAIMEKANEEFFYDADLEEADENNMCDVCCALNKTAFAIGRVIRNIEETI